MEARAVKQALDTERVPAQPTGACYSRPSILETTECSKVKLHKARAGVRRDPCSSVLPSRIFLPTSSPTSFFSITECFASASLLPARTVNSALGVSVCCCCLSAPDGYCLIDEVPPLFSENRHQAFSQSCFCVCWRSAAGVGFLRVLRAQLFCTSKQASAQSHVIFPDHSFAAIY